MQFICAAEGDPFRSDLETFVRTHYAEHYAADVSAFAPVLLGLVGNGRIHCAAGVRFDGLFFCETYLDDTIEAALGRRCGGEVTREAIFEVSNLCSRSPAVSRAFVMAIALFGDDHGREWSVFTATFRLRVLLTRMRLPQIELAEAKAERVEDPAVWGTYYETAPTVVAVNRSVLDDVVLSNTAGLAAAAVRRASPRACASEQRGAA